MASTAAQDTLASLLNPLTIQFNGPAPHDPQITDDRFYNRVLAGGSLALGESYMDGWWDCAALDEFFALVLGAGLDARVVDQPALAWAAFRAWLANRQRPSRAHQIGERHYDLGNELFEAMLDPRMIYSCAYWDQAPDLTAAQEAKLELICQKLRLTPGQRLLDIGCGWGGLAAYAAERHGVEVLGVTVSREQVDWGRQRWEGLPVELRLQDYRRLDQQFDVIVSVGMFEHVGHKNYRTYMQKVADCLAPGGLFLLQTIAGNTSRTSTDPWIEKYIFPNSLLPSARQISLAAEGLLILEDWHSFGADYDKTLLAWQDNFTANWEELAPAYGPRFQRMWHYYLMSCAGAFRSRSIQLWQIVFSKGGVPGGYDAPR
ncbi:MAG: cyclopropane fatty acyl phospholipid synthase [Deltaproteobacteria bacterium]|nr:cyclopropane fatty acyl phospholipid synthase [Deltaproteobacteria bacterium]